MKEIKEIKEQIGTATINLKSGQKEEVVTKTTYTIYEDGTQDCNVEIEKPVSIFNKVEKPNC